jgi:acid phosphatase (class A)
MALDEEISKRSLALQNSARWNLAILDADVKFPGSAGTFSCALGAPISEADTPHLYTLLRRSVLDAGKATAAAKNHYQRPRPFLLNNEPICTPEEREAYARNGAYPSGHATVGWTWALILAELAPEKSEALLTRGLAFGQSRVVCNLHWQSDVNQALILGAATVARLHAEPAFVADMNAARAEIDKVRAKDLPPTRDCAAEAEALQP